MKNKSNNNARTIVRIDWVIVETCECAPRERTTLAQDIRDLAPAFAITVAFGVALVAGCAAIAHMIA